MIALIDYGMGNLLSVSKALESVGGKIDVTGDPERIRAATSLVLPGVGNFGDGMQHLQDSGLKEPILDGIRSGKPFLGICLGMQMLLEESEEAPGVPGLGIFKGRVVRFPNTGEKVPHMGWNDLKIRGDHPLLHNIPDQSYFYFVHSYFADPENAEIILGTCGYIREFAAAIGRDNVFATQFHPEKSQTIGLRILENFIRLTNRFAT